MRVLPSNVNPGWFTVHIEPGELMCDYKAYPHATCIGVIKPHKSRKGVLVVSAWTPCGYKPRGYLRAAKRMLHELALPAKKAG